MDIEIASPWEEYELIDSGNGLRLERFGDFTLVRPDPQVMWQPHLAMADWQKADAVFEKGRDGKERWVVKRPVPARWLMHFQNISFWARLTPFKHTGVFPEQAGEWIWLKEKIESAGREVNILNMFAYTGIASLVAAAAGARVTHLDASRPAITWARDNQIASGLTDKPIRWIPDDAIKFTNREIKRGVKYDGIIMDPPVYGHGPNGERWDFTKDFPRLLENCKQILSDKPLFIIVNAYAVSASSVMLRNVLMSLNLGGEVESGELALQETGTGRLLSTGIFGRWSKSTL